MKYRNKRIMAVFFSMTLMASVVTGNTAVPVWAAPSQENSEETTVENEEDVIEIRDVKGFEELVSNCQYDSWSVGKTVKLVADIDISSLDFTGIAYFSGTFEGDGHVISHVTVKANGSNYGFFRYLSKDAVVNNLKLSGTVTSEGSCENIGGFAGVNYGTINECHFEGTVDGKKAVGAIVGKNKSTGKIIDCKSEATVKATNLTGGIAGENEGLITGCVSDSSVNTDELQTTMDLGGVDIGTLNLTQRMVDRNDMGGIAGASSGIISECTNHGTIGFAHTGYNAGGIAGRQSGKVIDCTNEGEVYGRKDIGGIVGQAEPYIESEYLEDKVDEVQDSVSSINNTLNHMASTVSGTSSAAKANVNSLTEQYQNASKDFSQSLDSLSDSIGESNPEAQQYVDNIEDSLNRINEIQGSSTILSGEQAEQISNEWTNINNNLSDVRGVVSDSNGSAEEFVDDISNQIKERDTYKDINQLTNTVDSGIQSVTNDVKKISNQMKSIHDTIGDTLSVVTGEEDYIEDISNAANAADTDGVISGSINRGSIQGDLNVGGIAGTMNVEYDLDPEFDLDLTNSTNIAVRSTVNDVIIHCINYGEVTSKKNCAAGITGLQELGLIYDSEGYGTVKSETGDYVGGIAGNSASAISDSYSLCNVEGQDYIGGIVGSGYTITDCISAATLESDGEASGSIAGTVSEEGDVKGNLFVNDKVDGIDNINYAGVADETSYEDIMTLENTPEGFRKVTITFKAEDEVVTTKTVAYNGNLNESELPEIPEKEDYYAKWPKEITENPITENKIVEAEYTRWTESIAGAERAGNSKALFLLEGKFYDDTDIQMSECTADIDEGEVVYSYEWKMENLHDKQYDTVKAHFYVPDTSGKNEIWYKDMESNTWVKAQAEENGGYLVAELPYEAAFALVHTPADNTLYYIGGGTAAVVLFLVLIRKIVQKRRKRRESKKKKGQ